MATDHQLVSWLKGRHPDSALAELLARYGPMVRRAALRVTGDAHAAEDVGQAVFLVLVRKSGSLGRVRSLGGLLHRLATDASRDWLKAESRRRRREEEAAKMKAARDQAKPAPLPAGFDAALNRLPAACREAVVTRYLHGLSGAEAAAELGVKEGTLEARLSRALARLRRALSTSSPGLTGAALGASLSGEATGAGALTTTQVASITAAAFGGARTTVAMMAEGMVKAMMWTKIKIAAAVICAATAVGAGGGVAVNHLAAAEPRKTEKKAERKSPLAGLPSPEGPHIARIKAMKDNSWLDLGSPKPDPKFGDGLGRAWGWKMPFAPKLRGAFIYGEGVHGFSMVRNGVRRYNDELFFYDINGHRWICCDPGTDVANYRAIINKDGFETRPDGEVAPVADCAHTYGMNTYDTDRGAFMTHSVPSTYWPKVIKGRKKFLADNKGKRNLDHASPYMWSAQKGRWDRRRTKMRSPRSLRLHTMLYIPTMKKAFGHSFTSQDIRFYDPATNTWETVKSKGPKNTISYCELHCYDSKRNRVYLAGGRGAGRLPKGSNALWVYDLKTHTWIDPKPKGSPCAGIPAYAITTAFMLYDSASDVVVMFSHKTGRDKSVDMRGMYVYDPARNAWATVSRSLPKGTERLPGHGFYDHKLNAHFYFAAGDSRGGGKMLVYRYKRAGGK